MGEGATNTISTITSAATTALTSLQGDVLNMVASVVPVAIVIMGAVFVIRKGVQAFRAASR